jgi:NAD-dependent SIR2 family protein deacetylase
MKLSDMKTQCRKCGKELTADSKDSDFATFYCMKCGIYTNRPIEEFKEPEPQTSCSCCASAPPDQQPRTG